jgi:hypothetical protein
MTFHGSDKGTSPVLQIRYKGNPGGAILPYRGGRRVVRRVGVVARGFGLGLGATLG